MSALMDWIPEWLWLLIAVPMAYFALTVAENFVKKIRERKRQPTIETKEESQQKKSDLEKPGEMFGSAVVQVRSAKDERDRYKAKSEAEEQSKELAKLRNQIKDLKRDHGRLRIQMCGSESHPMGLSLAVQFIELRDRVLAEKILGLFSSERQMFKMSEDNDIETVKWFRNPSDKARVVIFSDHPHAEGIKDAFSDCDLLEEAVDRFQVSVAGIEQVPFDIAIVVFPSDSSKHLTTMTQAEYDVSAKDKNTVYLITNGEND